MTEQSNEQTGANEESARYDEDQLVEWIACAQLSQSEIAKRLGVNRRTVWRIANGLSRPDLQRKIDAAVEGIRREARRQGARWLKALITRQIKVALEEDGETARKCREYLLDRFLVPDDGPARPRAPRHRRKPPSRVPSFTDGVSDDVKRMLIDELGGPPEKGQEDCRLSNDDCGTASEDDKADEQETKTERQNDSESGDKSPHSKETAPPPPEGDKERAKEPEKEPEQKQEQENENENENENRKPLRRVDPMIIEWKRQAEQKKKLDAERAEERRTRPIHPILLDGDREHREPHLFKKPIMVPWGIGMLIVGLLSVMT